MDEAMELLTAAKTLQHFCKSKAGCGNCPFLMKDEDCGLEMLPCQYRLEERPVAITKVTQYRLVME